MPHIRFPRTCSSYNWSFVPSGQPSVLERGSGWPVTLGPTVPGPQREQAWGGVRDSGLGAGASRAASFACSSRRPLPGAGPAACGSAFVARRLAGLTPSFPPLSSELLPNRGMSPWPQRGHRFRLLAYWWQGIGIYQLMLIWGWGSDFTQFSETYYSDDWLIFFFFLKITGAT